MRGWKLHVLNILRVLPNPACSMHIHHCLVWFSHQTRREQTAMDNQNCRIKSLVSTYPPFGIDKPPNWGNGREADTSHRTQTVPTSPLWETPQITKWQTKQTQSPSWCVCVCFWYLKMLQPKNLHTVFNICVKLKAHGPHLARHTITYSLQDQF